MERVINKDDDWDVIIQKMAKTVKKYVEKKRGGGMIMWKKRGEKRKRNIRTGEKGEIQNQELSMYKAEEMQKGWLRKQWRIKWLKKHKRLRKWVHKKNETQFPNGESKSKHERY